ncbi:hypothetical protein KFK09_009398 [Dendrobium nobile]|uniref:Uncharacterized protein n=1 Tax=Dendrobium nobile TaxID=94219 RepID=A0A8T3BJ79_DENNO|nr:hypothetical protein KFK09_009398 [Dendrobium nobile]
MFLMQANQGRYFDQEISDRFLIKLPGELGKEIHDKWKATYPNNDDIKHLGIGPRIVFTFWQLQEKCKEYKIQKQVKKQSYAFCRNIYTSQSFPEKKRRKILRKSKRKFPRKDRNFRKPSTRKCHCYICGSIGKMQEHPHVKFKLNNETLESMLASEGIKAISGKKFSPEIYAGLEWNLSSFLDKPIFHYHI